MRYLWLIRSLPELQGLTPRARAKLLRLSGGKGQFSLFFLTAFCIVPMSPLAFVPFFFLWQSHSAPGWVAWPAYAVTLGLLAAIVYQALLAGVRADLRKSFAHLAPKGRLEKCLDCDYDLRATPGPTCPECGSSVTLVGTPPTKTATK